MPSGGAMRTFYFLLSLAITLVMGAPNTDQVSTSVASRGKTLVVATAGKLAVRVTIITHEMQIGKPSDGRPVVIQSNCTYSKYPCSIVDRVEVTVNGDPLFVPRSAFCDLA